MADNLTTQSTTLATIPSASVIATDDVAGVHFQKIKIDVGGDGASVALSNSNPMPVSDAGGSLTVDGSVSVSALPAGSLAASTAVTSDMDTGGGTQNVPLVGIGLPASGGAVVGGTFTNPVRMDPTGTTAQPVTVSSVPKSSTASTPAQTSIGTTAGVVLSSNANRKRFSIQNTGTTILRFTFGGTNPTGTAYHFALAPGTVADDATGAFFADDLWTGDVRGVSSASGGTAVITELT